jgi:survival-of-motor-neuron-related-splicing factor 30
MASQLEEERQQYAEQVSVPTVFQHRTTRNANRPQLEIVGASLRDDPGNAELQALKDELDQMMQMIDESLAELKPKQQPAPQQQQKPAPKPASPPPPPPQEKWSRENHPAFKKSTPTPAAPPVAEQDKEQVIHYQVNDTVVAKWMSGDRGFYPARITAVTGSSTKPMYTVKFKSYDTIETLGARDIRPVGGATAGQKRKAEETATPTPAPTPATSSNGVVLAAPATVYPAQEKKDEEKPVKKFKKIKATKELEKGKSKWQEFNAKAAGKMGKHKKDSMFRTPEGVGGRGMFPLLLLWFGTVFTDDVVTVGFTGSGQAMRKDPTRTRHIYQPAEDQD